MVPYSLSSGLQLFKNWLWGYDFFISYHWSSGGTYAVNLAAQLREKGYEVFLDRAEYAMGDKWKEVGEVALNNTQRLVLVATREAVMESEPVEHEIIKYTDRGRIIIPIFFGDTFSKERENNLVKFVVLERLPNDTLYIEEASDNLSVGPAPGIVDKLALAHGIIRRRKLRQIMVSTAIILLSIFVLFATVSWVNAVQSRNALERQLLTALYNSGIEDFLQGRIELGESKIKQAINKAGNQYPQIVRGLLRHLSVWQEELGILIKANSIINTVAFDESSNRMIIFTYTERMVFNRSTGALQKDIEIGDPVFSINMKWMLTSNRSGSKSLWHIHHSNRQQKLLEGNGNAILDLTTDHKQALVRNDKNSIEVWDLPSGNVRQLQVSQKGIIKKGGFSPNGELFFLERVDNETSMIDILKTIDFATLRTTINLDNPVNTIGFFTQEASDRNAQKHQYSFFTIGNGIPYLWNFNDKHPKKLPWMIDDYAESSIALSRDGRTIWIRFSDQPHAFLYCVNTVSGRRSRISERNTPLDVLTYDPNSGRLLAAFMSGMVRIDDCQSEGEDVDAFTLTRLHSEETVRSVAIGSASKQRLPDTRGSLPNTIFLTASRYKVQVWGTATNGPVAPPLQLNSPVVESGFTPDNKSIFVISRNSVRLRSTTPSMLDSETRILPKKNGPNATLEQDKSIIKIKNLSPGIDHDILIQDAQNVIAVAIDPYGKHLAVGYRDGKVRLSKEPFDLSEAKVADHGEAITCLEFSHDGSVLLSGGSSTIKLWSAENLRHIGFSIEHGLERLSVASFSPDNEFFAVGGGKYARFFDIATEQALGRLLVHSKSRWNEELKNITFSTDGNYLISETDFGETYYWRAPKQEAF